MYVCMYFVYQLLILRERERGKQQQQLVQSDHLLVYISIYIIL